MTPDDLRKAIHTAFDYADDNNRDLVGDATFTLDEVQEELNVKWAKDFLSAYIARNEDMIRSNLEEL